MGSYGWVAQQQEHPAQSYVHQHNICFSCTFNSTDDHAYHCQDPQVLCDVCMHFTSTIIFNHPTHIALQGTFHLDRSNAFQFLQYVITAGLWHNSCIGPVVEFARAKCWRVVRQAGVGMAAYYLSGLAVLVLGGWRLFVVLYAWPYVANIGYASVINWAWHAFANPDNPTNYMSECLSA